jgi:uncharacterized membrane protein YphA (DoxX/SURF4 family)/peroxiredoxin
VHAQISKTVELALLSARLLLATVFLLAGVAKLGDPKGTTKALRDFGMSPRFAALLSPLLSLGEIAVGVTLIPVALAWYGACGALALISIFVVSIVVMMARGRKPDCHCFGQLHSAPVGRSTLVRNAVLGLCAGWLVFRGPLRVGPSLWEHLASAGDNERKMFIFAGCIVCFLFFRALSGRGRAAESTTSDWELDWDWDDDPSPAAGDEVQSGPVPRREPNHPAPPRMRTPGPPVTLTIGAAAPVFELPSMNGQRCSLETLRGQGKLIFLVFSSPHCDPCRALLPKIGSWMREHEKSLNIVVVSRGTAKENLTKMSGAVDPSRVLLQQDFEISAAYGCTATPSAVLVGTDGLIQSDLVVGREAVQELLSSSAKPTGVPAQHERTTLNS